MSESTSSTYWGRYGTLLLASAPLFAVCVLYLRLLAFTRWSPEQAFYLLRFVSTADLAANLVVTFAAPALGTAATFIAHIALSRWSANWLVLLIPTVIVALLMSPAVVTAVTLFFWVSAAPSFLRQSRRLHTVEVELRELAFSDLYPMLYAELQTSMAHSRTLRDLTEPRHPLDLRSLLVDSYLAREEPESLQRLSRRTVDSLAAIRTFRAKTSRWLWGGAFVSLTVIGAVTLGEPVLPLERITMSDGSTLTGSLLAGDRSGQALLVRADGSTTWVEPHSITMREVCTHNHSDLLAPVLAQVVDRPVVPRCPRG